MLQKSLQSKEQKLAGELGSPSRSVSFLIGKLNHTKSNSCALPGACFTKGATNPRAEEARMSSLVREAGTTRGVAFDDICLFSPPGFFGMGLFWQRAALLLCHLPTFEFAFEHWAVRW